MTPTRSATWVLVLTSLAQFVLQLDFAIVNVALATVQHELGFSNVGLQWVVTGYALTFGALLLVGGRAGDLFGHRRMLVSGLVLFAIASLTGGMAQEPWELVVSRLVQGAGAAMVAPSAIAMLTHAYDDPHKRAHALGIFQGSTAVGGTAGIVLGGVLTEYAGWRWVLLVNPPVIAILVVFALMRLPGGRGHSTDTRVDLPGAAAVTGAMGALIFGVSRGQVAGFGSPSSWLALVAAAVLLVGFAAIETGSKQPMLPLPLLRQPERAGAVVIVFLVGAVFAGYVYFIALYLQHSLGFSAIRTGLALVPATGTALVMSTMIARRFLATIGPWRLLVAAVVLVAAGQLWLSHVSADGSYVADVLPGIVATAGGLGLAMPAASFAITLGVEPQYRGIAGGLFVTALQVGSAVGLGVLATVASERTDSTGSLVDGYRLAYTCAAGLMLMSLVLAAWLLAAVRRRAPQLEPARPAA